MGNEKNGAIPVMRWKLWADVLTLKYGREQIRTLGGGVAIVVGLAVSLLMAQGGGSMMAGWIDTSHTIKSVTAAPLSADRPPMLLTVRMDATINDRCTRQSFSVAWINVAGGEDKFWPASSSMQGGPHQPTADREGRVILIHTLVAGMSPGQYKWRLKTISLCSWLGGLIRWEKHEQSPIMTFTVP